MTDLEKNDLFTDCYELLDIFKESCPIQDNGTFIFEAIKPCYISMIDYVMKDDPEVQGFKDFLDKTDFWLAPASTRFHGNFKGGLSLHTLMVLNKNLIFANNMFASSLTCTTAAKYTMRLKE